MTGKTKKREREGEKNETENELSTREERKLRNGSSSFQVSTPLFCCNYISTPYIFVNFYYSPTSPGHASTWLPSKF